MSAEGAIWLHRRALESWLWELPAPQFKVAMTVLLKANWKPGTGWSGGERVEIDRGEFLTSYRSLALATKTESEKTVRTTLANLEKADFAARRAARKGQVVSVKNYDVYQPDPNKGGKVSGRTAAGQRQDSGNDRRREEGKKGRTSRTSSSEVESAAGYFLEGFNSYFGQARQPRAWLDDVRKALAAGYSADEMRGAAWGAKQRCADSPDVLRNFRPSTVLRLKSREGKTTLPQWLELADEVWDELNPGKPAPWWGKRPVLEVVRG